MSSIKNVLHALPTHSNKMMLFACGIGTNSWDVADDCADELDINDCFDDTGRSILNFLIAVGQTNDENWKYMIDHGFEINKCDDSGYTALDIACAIGSVDDVKRALQYGANIHYPVEPGEYHTMHGILVKGRTEILDILSSQHTIDWGRIVSDRFNPVMIVLQRGNLPMLGRLLNMNLLDYINGLKCLQYAVENNLIEAARLLLEHGVDGNAMIPAKFGYGIEVKHDGQTYYCLRVADIAKVKNNNMMQNMLQSRNVVVSAQDEIEKYKKRSEMRIIE